MDLTGTALELGRAIGRGAADPVEAAEALLEAARSHEAVAQIYARFTPKRALEEAKAARARARAGVRKGPLDGVPISWKDLYDSAGIATESGSRLLKGRVPARDAAVLARASAAGLVCLGKTHQTELAFSGLGINEETATPPNGIAPERAPGGSSSGAAVSVRLGMAMAGIGSDTGGSVRIPAAWNDLVGLKTAWGDLPLTGVVPLCPRFDTVGPICRDVADAAALHAVLACRKAPDLAGAGLRGRRFLVLKSAGLAPVDDAPQAAVEAAFGQLSGAGAVIEEAEIGTIDAALALSGVLYTPEAYGIWGDVIEAAPQKMNSRIRDRFRAGRDHSGPEYVAAWQQLEKLRRAYREKTAAYDLVLLPTSPILPPDRARLIADEPYFVAQNLYALRNTRVANLMGLAALSLPTGTPHCGIMAMAEGRNTPLLLRLCAAMEAALI